VQNGKPIRRMTFDLDLGTARSIVAALDGSLRPQAVRRLHGGSTEVYRIDLARGADPIVVKIYRDEPQWAPAKEALVAGWLAEGVDLPTPRWLRLDESRRLLPHRYALTTWLAGQPVRAMMAEPGVVGLYRQMGAWLKRLHGLPMPAYGYVLADGVASPQVTNADYMDEAFEDAFRQFAAHGGDAALARRLERALRPRLPLAAASAGPVFAHDDFQPGNLLAARDASGALALTGLVDFGNARAADPLFDLAKALFCCTHEDPRIQAPLLAGYGAIDHPDPQGALWLHTLYHRLIMWSWLTRQGDGHGGRPGLLRDLEASVG